MFINDIRSRSLVLLILSSLLLLAGCGDDKDNKEADSTKDKNPPLDINKSFSLIYGGQTGETNSPEIVVIKADGKSNHLITKNFNIDRNPNYCVKTKQITFVSNINENFDVYVSDIDGKNKKNLSLHAKLDENPVFTPDCKFVIFESERDGNKEIYQVGVDGSGLKRLTNNKVIDPGPYKISPDGRYIAFRQVVQKPIPHYSIMLLDRSTLKITKLTKLSVEEGVPDWAPNGKFLVFSALENFEWRLYKILPNGTGMARIDNPKTTSEIQPVISPDSSKIGFIGSFQGDFDVWIADSSGKKFTKLTDGLYARSDISFSPDNKFVAYTQKDQNSRFNIFLSSVDGKKKFQLTSTDDDDRDPQWIVE